jgi:hypothetical protein
MGAGKRTIQLSFVGYSLMLWSLLTFLSFLAYIVEARPFFRVAFGEYSVGLLDDLLTTILSLIAIFYWKAKKDK